MGEDAEEQTAPASTKATVETLPRVDDRLASFWEDVGQTLPVQWLFTSLAWITATSPVTSPAPPKTPVPTQPRVETVLFGRSGGGSERICTCASGYCGWART